jgi:Putative zinc-finger
LTLPCRAPAPLEDLIAWERGELDPAASDQLEEHVFGCGECTRRLEGVAGLAAGIRELVAAGAIPAAVSGQLAERAEERGLRLRTYRLAPGETVACTAGPLDDFVVVRLGLEVEEGESVDLVAEVADLQTGGSDTRLTEDVPIDRGAGEIVYLYPGAAIRSLPRSLWSVTARVRGPKGERELGPYTLDHTPWEQLTDRR